MIKLILFFISISFIASGCSTVKDAFDPQRKNGSEEFLVEKKSPLSMPPNFGELPVPKNEKQKNIDEENDIQSLILSNENDQQNSINTDSGATNSNLENSILDQIKNN